MRRSYSVNAPPNKTRSSSPTPLAGRCVAAVGVRVASASCSLLPLSITPGAALRGQPTAAVRGRRCTHARARGLRVMSPVPFGSSSTSTTPRPRLLPPAHSRRESPARYPHARMRRVSRGLRVMSFSFRCAVQNPLHSNLSQRGGLDLELPFPRARAAIPHPRK